MQVEIKRDVQLTEEQEARLDLHSFFNVLGVVTAQLQALGSLVEVEGCCKESIERTLNVRRGLAGEAAFLRFAENYDEIASVIFQDVTRAIDTADLSAVDRAEAHVAQEAIGAALDILEARIDEYEARLRRDATWEPHRVDKLRADLVGVLQAMEKNARGRYRIVLESAEHAEDSYLVQLEITGDPSDGEVLTMPPVMQDVLRDLVANARKYTDPGGTIRVRLAIHGDEFRLEVRDNGRGIPADQLDRVVDFGYRASNVSSLRTMGGGFGLTKAYVAVRSHGGRLWIDSAERAGTTITCAIPTPR